MNEIKLLILDDDETVITSYQETIKRINRDDNNIIYKVFEAKTLTDAEEIIKYNKLDTAIIDLNLCSDGTNPDNSDGNEAVKKLMKNFRMPIFVVSGETKKLESGLESNHLIKVYTRDKFEAQSGLENIIPPLYFSKSMHYFSRDGLLEKMINEFYWNHLSKTIESWEQVEGEYLDDIEKILSRHTVSSLNEQLYVNGNVGSFDKYHPGEMYIIPPIKQHYHTGDIVEKDGEKFIIMNPACDIVNKGKLHNYMLLSLIELNTFFCFDEYVKRDKEYPTFCKSLNKKGKEIYLKYKSNGRGASYHFLPSFSDFIANDYIINFQEINIVDTGEDIVRGEEESEEEFNIRYLKNREKYVEAYERIASISSPFLKDIIARFSAYYARQGQPNLL